MLVATLLTKDSYTSIMELEILSVKFTPQVVLIRALSTISETFRAMLLLFITQTVQRSVIIMKFKRNLTVSFACGLTEFLLSVIPALFIVGLSLNTEGFVYFFKIGISLIIIGIPAYNIFLYLLNLVFNLFQKMTITLKDECLVIENKGILQTIYYKDVTHISFYLGNLFVERAKPVTLSLYCKENKVSFEVTNPSLIMTHLIKKKCPTAQVNYIGLKRVLHFLEISTIAGIVIVILEYFGIPWMD